MAPVARGETVAAAPPGPAAHRPQQQQQPKSHHRGGEPAESKEKLYCVEPATPSDIADICATQTGDAVVFFQGEAEDEPDSGDQRAGSLAELDLRVVYDPTRNSLEESVNFPIVADQAIAGQYVMLDYLGSGVFSRAVQCVELGSGRNVCVKIVRNNKDFLDQSLGEIKLLKYLNEHDPHDSHHILRMLDYFYYKEHLFIVTELLRDNLHELYKYIQRSGWTPYFTLARVTAIGKQMLSALRYVHSLGLIHLDVKPENVLVASLSRCVVKLIDFGSSAFVHDPHSSYVQSRVYRAPEVVVGMPYGQRVDVWSLGCILAEVYTGRTLFCNRTASGLLAGHIALCGPLPERYLAQARHSSRYFHNGRLYKQLSAADNDRAESRNSAASSCTATDGGDGGRGSPVAAQYAYIRPLPSSLDDRLGGRTADGFLAFMKALLAVDDSERLSAEAALQHPWIREARRPPRYDPGTGAPSAGPSKADAKAAAVATAAAEVRADARVLDIADGVAALAVGPNAEGAEEGAERTSVPPRATGEPIEAPAAALTVALPSAPPRMRAVEMDDAPSEHAVMDAAEARKGGLDAKASPSVTPREPALGVAADGDLDNGGGDGVSHHDTDASAGASSSHSFTRTRRERPSMDMEGNIKGPSTPKHFRQEVERERRLETLGGVAAAAAEAAEVDDDIGSTRLWAKRVGAKPRIAGGGLGGISGRSSPISPSSLPRGVGGGGGTCRSGSGGGWPEQDASPDKMPARPALDFEEPPPLEKPPPPMSRKGV